MNTKNIIKKIVNNNPFSHIHRQNLRKRLINTSPTFLCPNCIGGILFHDLGLKFNSPTINLMITQTDFLKFVLNLDEYLKQELVFFDHSEYKCPCAFLGDIVVHFTHYSSEEEAAKKWHERKTRIKKDNLFIFMTERDGLTRNDILSLNNIQAKGIVVFTANDYPDITYTLQIPKYSKSGEVGNILKKNWFTGSREYERYFDFVKWFNEADENVHSVSKYKK